MNMSNESNKTNNKSNKTNHHDYPSLNDYEIVLLGVFFPIILPIIVFQLQLKVYAIMLISIIIGITYATFTIKTINSMIGSILMLLFGVITVAYSITPVNDNIRVLSFIIPLIIGLAGTYAINYYIKNNNANNSIHNVNINSKNDDTYFTM